MTQSNVQPPNPSTPRTILPAMPRLYPHDRSNRPRHRKPYIAADEHLAQQRSKLIRLLDTDHALAKRTNRRTGRLIITDQRNTPPRKNFTDDQIKDFKRKRRNLPDPDGASSRLLDSQLLNMWNSDCVADQQWEDYNAAVPLMEANKQYSRLPERAFQPRRYGGRKRKRCLDAGKLFAITSLQARSDDEKEEASDEELEDGEIEDDEERSKIESWHRVPIERLYPQGFEGRDDMMILSDKGSYRGADVDEDGVNPTAASPTSPPDSDTDDSDESDLDVELDESDALEVRRSFLDDYEHPLLLII